MRTNGINCGNAAPNAALFELPRVRFLCKQHPGTMLDEHRVIDKQKKSFMAMKQFRRRRGGLPELPAPAATWGSVPQLLPPLELLYQLQRLS